MDIYNATGVPQTDDTFGFVPPDFINGIINNEKDHFACKEEKERYYYNLDHEHDTNNLH